MIDVIPLKYGPAFKKIFSKPEIFSQFASDVLDIPLKFNVIHTEYEYPERIGLVRNKYDLFAEDETQRIIVEIQHVKESDFFDRFLYYHLISLVEQVQGFKAYYFERTFYTIVVLTTTPRDQSIDFSYAATDWNPVDEYGRKKLVYPHRLIFLAPRLVNDKSPSKVHQWLKLIADSLDGKVNEKVFTGNPFQEMLEEMHRFRINPDDLAAIKDEAAWENAQAQSREEGREEGFIEGKLKGIAEGEARGEAKCKLEGKLEGKNEGLTQGTRDKLERLLIKRFGQLSPEIKQQLRDAPLEQLDVWFDRSIDAPDLKSIFTNNATSN